MNHFVEVFLINTRLCIMEVSTNPTRSFLTSFGIFLGIASLLINISFIRALDEDILQNLEKIGGLNIITLKIKTPIDKNETRFFNRSPGLKMTDAYEIAKQFSYVANVLPDKDLNWKRVSANGKNTYAHIKAVGSEHYRIYDIHVQYGKLLSEDDYIKRQKFCLIGRKTAKDLYNDPLSAVGKSITINSTTFIIKGIILTEEDYEMKARTIFYPHSFYTYRYGESSGTEEEIAIELKNSSFVNQAVNDFQHFLKRLHRGVEDTEVLSNVTKMDEMRKASFGIHVLLLSIATISLIGGGISIMNIMFATIGDRIKEIGIRKAIGAKKIDIFIQFIIEAVMLCFVGGFPGMLIGASVTLFPKGFFPYNPTLKFSDFLLAIGFTIITGFISGLSPSIMAARMQPAQALKY